MAIKCEQWKNYYVVPMCPFLSPFPPSLGLRKLFWKPLVSDVKVTLCLHGIC